MEAVHEAINETLCKHRSRTEELLEVLEGIPAEDAWDLIAAVGLLIKHSIKRSPLERKAVLRALDIKS